MRHGDLVPAILALGAALGGGLAHADGPSFDCGRAKTPIEVLICNDPELIRLDRLLGEAYATRLGASDAKDGVKTEQRAWLGSRFTRCPIPKSGAALGPAQTWEAAPCLATLYAERLAALGGDPAVAPPDPRTAEPGFVHPICIEIALGSDLIENRPPPAPVALAACNRGNRHRPVTLTETGFLSAADARDGYQGSFSYLLAGTLADGRRVAHTVWWGGGSGSFTNAVVLSEPTPGELAAKVVVPGGDRCFGGIERVQVVGPDAIEVASMVTAADFVGLGDAPPPERLVGGLPSCALCCMATAHHRYDLATTDGTDGTLVSTVVTAIPGGPEGDVETCVFGLIEKLAPTQPTTLDAAQTTRLIADIVAQCGKSETP